MASSAMSHDDFRALSRQPPADPDILATLSDFLTYTEHFPSHLTRALTLIHEQRIRAEEKIRSIHDDTTAYSILPTITKDRPDPVELRRRISYALEEAETACRMAVVEADRLDLECKKEARKLDIVVRKLRAQPKPPSRDPTPEQQQLTSPNLKREAHFAGRADESRVDKISRRMQDKAASKLRGRKIMVPGEVLPPPDPNAPWEDMSDWTSPRNSPPLLEEPTMSILPRDRDRDRKTTTPRQRSHTPKQLLKPRGPRLPGQPGTNAHSAVAGISTSNALLALTRPPDDAPKGSRWSPWLKLTEWEMANLRKRMKKNAIWVPSQTMVRRELKLLGRGLSAKEAARAHAEATGEPFVDEHGETDPTGPGGRGEGDETIGVLASAQVAYDDDEDADAELVNRGMRLNEAKKLKRQRMQEELQEQIAREQGDEPSSEVGKTVSMSPEANKKRKRDSDSTAPTSIALPTRSSAAAATTAVADAPDFKTTAPPPKKIRLAAGASSTATATNSTTTKVPLAPEGVSSSPSSKPSRPHRGASPLPPTITTLDKKPPPTLNLRRNPKAVSEEPPATSTRRAALRRGSTTSMPDAPAAEETTSTTTVPADQPPPPKRRSKRPAPGIVTSSAADGQTAKGVVSQRKAAPRRAAAAAAAASAANTQLTRSSTKRASSSANPNNNTITLSAVPEDSVPVASTTTTPSSSTAAASAAQADAPLDPNEPTYCLCGDVSWGTMIACDNEEECEGGEWFHLECVGLTSLPPRRGKWFCPECKGRGKGGAAG
jgi:hypothetical protein